jgi:hypothetical protein
VATVENSIAEIAIYKKVALPAELLLSKSHNYKLILSFEMASCFIAYVPKPTKEKHSSKPFDKISNSQQIEQNPMPIGVSAIDSNLLAQKCNSGDSIIVEGILIQHILLCLILIEAESLTEICNSSDSHNKDSDNSEFPPIHKIRSNYWEKQQAS